MKIILTLSLVLGLLVLSGCKKDTTYRLMKVDAEVECACKEVKQSIKWIKKQYKAKKGIELFDAILVPIDVVGDNYFVYKPFRIIQDCTPQEYQMSEDSIFYQISPEQWKVLKDYKCSP